jgi:hypothetical protein
MTSAEIKGGPDSSSWADCWLREIAYQLAVMNERTQGYDGGDLPTTPGKQIGVFYYSADTDGSEK